MQVVIVGAGSMGCLLGGYLARAGHAVHLVDVIPERVDAIREKGVVVEGVGGDFEVHPSAGTSYDGPSPDLIVVAVKAYDTDRAGALLESWVGEETSVLTLQNGVGNITQLAHYVPREQILAGTTSVGANLLRPGHVHHAGEGETFVGDFAEEDRSRAEVVARVLTEARLPTTATLDIRSRIWSKLAVNVGINALTAILQVRNGRLLIAEQSTSVLEDAVRECVAVAIASGIELQEKTTLKRALEVARLTASNRSSMLMDVLAARRTEIDAINGAAVRRGDELGVPVPVNRTLTRLVHAMETVKDLREG